jgi:hypothetical protein
MENCEKCERLELLGKVNKLGKELYGKHLEILNNDALRTIVEENRGSGRSTATALAYISQAMRHPHKPVRLIHDHMDMPVNNKEMCMIVERLIEKLEFKYLVVRRSQNTLTYEI